MNELKSCPFCGETSVFVRYKVDYYPLGNKNLVYQAICPTCGIRTKKDTSYTDTVDRWNKRASDNMQIKAVTLEEYKQ